MASVLQKEINYKKTGISTSVANEDIAKLMYYLRCCTKCCGIDVIQDEFLDHKNHQLLSREKEDLVILAAYQYSPDELINKVIFLDDDGSLCGDALNEFYELEQVTKLLAVQSLILISGKQTEVSKIMVFRKSWMQTFYLDPMKRQSVRLERAIEQLRSPSPTLSNLFDLSQLLSSLAESSAQNNSTNTEVPKQAPRAYIEEEEEGVEEKRDKYFYDNMSVGQLKTYLENHNYSTSGISDKTELKKIVWYCYCDALCVSYLYATLRDFGIDPTIFSSVAEARKKAKSFFKSENRAVECYGRRKEVPKIPDEEASSSVIEAGYNVELFGLKNESMNGKTGVVADGIMKGGRYEVILDEGGRVKVKPGNLELLLD